MNLPEHPAVDAYTGFLLRKVSSASFGAFAKLVADHGLHPMHFGMLSILASEEPISQQELGRRSGVDPSTMVARMDVLVERGLVERTRGVPDRRSYEIRVTPAGHDVLAELREKARAHGERFFAPLTLQERAQLHALLTKLAASLDDTAC